MYPPNIIEIAIILTIALVIFIVILVKKILTLDGALAALIIALTIGLFGHLLLIVLLLLFLGTSFVVTRYKFEYKKMLHVQEGVRGERGIYNVLANGLIPALLPVIQYLFPAILLFSTSNVLFVSAIAVAAADTTASELGVLSNRAYLITTFKRVRPGTNGAISLFGEFVAFLAALYTSVVGYILLTLTPGLYISKLEIIIVPLIAGFFGCQVDSFIGATLETRGYVTKGITNFISILLGVVIAAGLLYVL